MLIKYAQLPPLEYSADRIFITDNAIIILDGASAFEPVALSPTTFAHALGEIIASQLSQDPSASLPMIVATAIATVARDFCLVNDTSPSSTISILRLDEEVTDLYVLGDSSICYGSVANEYTLKDDRLEHLSLPARDRYRARLLSGTGYDAEHTQLVRESQIEQRAYRNVAGGYWIAATSPDAAYEAFQERIVTNEISWAVLATDGASDLIAHLKSYSWRELANLDSGRLGEVLRDCHRWEENRDPDGRQLVRGKRHDDKTIAAAIIS